VNTNPLTLAIATRDYGKYSETFVRRHVQHLFSGKTAVVSFRPVVGPKPDRPIHVFKEARKIAPRWRRPLVPFIGTGRERQIRERDDELLRFLRRTGATHLLCEFGYVATELAGPIRRMDLPAFCYFRGTDATREIGRKAYAEALRSILPHMVGIVSVSRFLLDRLAEAGIEHANAIVLPSGTDIDRFRPGATSQKHLFTVGRLVGKKDPLTALEAFAKVARTHDDLRWTIAGTGPLEASFRKRAESLGLGGRIDLPGALSHDEVANLMCRATAYFQAFRTAPDGDCEGMPSVIQEAMAAGRAIVTTRHAGIPEHIVDGETGLLSDEGDVDGLASALGHVVASSELRNRLGRAARAHAEAELDYRTLYSRLEEFMTDASS
jgi:glycosyltransferase involved in cell wall biosynthesis